MVVRIQIAFKTIKTENWEFESKEDHLQRSNSVKHTVLQTQVELKYRKDKLELENKNIVII